MYGKTAAIATAAALAAALLSAGTASAGDQATGDLLVLGTDGVLSTYDTRKPLLPTRAVRVRGVASGDRLIGIDVRPATKTLYALSANGQLYTVDSGTGSAAKVGTPVALSGKAIGFDFNPVVDRVRVVTDRGQNLRLVPDTGALAGTDGTLAYATGDPGQGRTPAVGGAGYTNSVAGATSTALYDIDAARDTLVLQGSAPGATPVVSPNTGRLSTVGRLGVDVSTVLGFDIRGAASAGPYNPSDYRAVAAVRGRGLLGLGVSYLVDVNLATGRARVLSPLLRTATPVGLAFTG
ncbi:DUF4394 domain-containing protein [Actinokineospora sp. NBRC 105648]|uniref:DUF4394 domain-containing protein n=1 Tax=Actinokineospora sp. NBRC 105648 TaxID=3032206 RepID=UPI0024A35E0E|nr:DUF4394 domain-containing protein [Actinokineospora sp. NBRC 105648]GLZ36945.1 hypothetical protein Acsp05_05700 [Actinokineospora sp. NBRC 105648]